MQVPQLKNLFSMLRASLQSHKKTTEWWLLNGADGSRTRVRPGY